ncbi:AAC(3) family N-acetyltransferase [Crocinitomicaceae bacterium]|nr:AAC(3) family N-acetyltransferase [Crocinitomicaceae bacterium]
MPTKISGTYLNLAASLQLKSSDSLFIASDVKQMALDARNEGSAFNANAFIESFQEQLSDGTLLIPAYTDNLKNGDTFDHVKSKPTTGALSNKVGRRKDFLRSKDPLHSAYVWGKGASEIAELDGNSSLGEGSIFHWMHDQGAKMICVDVHFQNSLTYVHFVEERRKVKYRKAYNWIIKRKFKEHSDEKSFVFYSRQPWVLTDLELLQNRAIESGVAKVFQLNNAQILYFDILEMHQLIETMLDNGEKLHRISLIHYAKGIAKKILGRE